MPASGPVSDDAEAAPANTLTVVPCVHGLWLGFVCAHAGPDPHQMSANRTGIGRFVLMQKRSATPVPELARPRPSETRRCYTTSPSGVPGTDISAVPAETAPPWLCGGRHLQPRGVRLGHLS